MNKNSLRSSFSKSLMLWFKKEKRSYLMSKKKNGNGKTEFSKRNKSFIVFLKCLYLKQEFLFI